MFPLFFVPVSYASKDLLVRSREKNSLDILPKVENIRKLSKLQKEFALNGRKQVSTEVVCYAVVYEEG